jgi:hypothetical protein
VATEKGLQQAGSGGQLGTDRWAKSLEASGQCTCSWGLDNIGAKRDTKPVG